VRDIKRLFDIIASIVALIFLLPVLGIITLLVYFDDGAPVVFKQQRVGRHNREFTIYKFRTMPRDTRNRPQQLTAKYGKFTRSGKLLRALSLDELPQLWNILRGDMSFVGPRPLIPEERRIRKLREEAGIYAVPPGLTGWAQVNGRAKVNDRDKVALDAEYIAKQSFWLDIKILFLTVKIVLTKDNVT